MKKIKLQNTDSWLKQELKSPVFRKVFEAERAKVSLAQKISALRRERRLKQSELAEKLHVSQQYVSRLETGLENNMTIDTLVRIAATLGHSVQISFPETTSAKQAHLSIL